MTADGQIARGYVNGVEDGTREVGAPYLLFEDEPLIIGESHFPAPVFFKGIIDEVAFYNRALSPEEVNQLMDNPIVGASAVEATGKLATTWATIKE